MEGKTMIVSIFIMSLVMAQIQVEANICCPSTSAIHEYDKCTIHGQTREICFLVSGCRSWDTCPPGWIIDILENSGNAVNEYCKLGCTSSVCGAMATLQKIDTSELVSGAVEKCAKACSTFCTKGTKIAVETA